MNSKRRKQVRLIIDELRAITELLEEVGSEEEEALFSTPENLQNTDRYLQTETNVEVFNDLIDNINTAIDELECM